MDYRKYIERSFEIIDKDNKRVSFILNKAQSKFIETMTGRDFILKARQEGFSSLILAIFLVDFLTLENSRGVVISHETEATIKLFDRAKFFLQTLADKGIDIPLKYSSRREMVNEALNSTLYIQTAGAKGLLRGETITNLHFSEPAFYANDPEKICLGAMQSVIPSGRIIFESTANGIGNYYHREWVRAERGESNFKPHFFSREFYDNKFLDDKRKEFAEESLFNQEYPLTPLEAFIASGRPFFNLENLQWYLDHLVKAPIKIGYLMAGDPIHIDENPKGYWKFWELPRPGESYIITCDIGEVSDYSAASVLKRKTNEVIATFHGHLDSGELAANLATAGRWFNNAVIAPEKNGLGMGVLTGLKGLSYGNIYRRKTHDKLTDKTGYDQGWLTTSSTRPLMLSNLQTMITDKGLKVYDKDSIEELMTFYRDEKTGKPEAQVGCHDDRVISLAILARLIEEQPTSMETEDEKFDQADYNNKWRIGKK